MSTVPGMTPVVAAVGKPVDGGRVVVGGLLVDELGAELVDVVGAVVDTSDVVVV
ncbi:hypothetical protein [Actinokineospora sp.]|uniref:hypothetical protein n=1 Tax=Actinokineospora sp. TaxID=1872133 RepID=UPI003D6B8FFB